MQRALLLSPSALLLILAAGILAAGCPKPQPDPVPADCDKPGQACASKPAPEAPPPLGTSTPGPQARR